MFSNPYLHEFQGAMEDYNQAIMISPKDHDLYQLRGWTKSDLLDYRGAIEDFNISIELYPKNSISLDKEISSAAYYGRGFAKSQLKNYKGAITDYNNAIFLTPNNPLIYCDRGRAKIAMKLKDSGCLDLSKAGELGLMSAFDEIKKFCY